MSVCRLSLAVALPAMLIAGPVQAQRLETARVAVESPSVAGAVLAAGITWYAVRRSPCTDYCLVDDAAAPLLAAIPGFLVGAGVGWLIEQGRKQRDAR